MQFYSQKKDCCLATALYQVGAISLGVLQEYEKSILETTTPRLIIQRAFCEKYLKQLVSLFDSNPLNLICGNPLSVPSKGKGILVVMNNPLIPAHALSYENGAILDPEGNGKRETWKEYTHRNHSAKIIRIIPTD